MVEVPNLANPRLGRIAQLVEQLTLNQRVQGSNPCAPTTSIKHLADFQFVVSTSCQRLISTNSPFRSRFKSLACKPKAEHDRQRNRGQRIDDGEGDVAVG